MASKIFGTNISRVLFMSLLKKPEKNLRNKRSFEGHTYLNELILKLIFKSRGSGKYFSTIEYPDGDRPEESPKKAPRW